MNLSMTLAPVQDRAMRVAAGKVAPHRRQKSKIAC
jgi:hypothetical protein